MCATRIEMVSDKTVDKDIQSANNSAEEVDGYSRQCNMCGSPNDHASISRSTRKEVRRSMRLWNFPLQLILLLLVLAVCFLTVKWQIKQMSCVTTEQLQEIYERIQILESRYIKEGWRLRFSRSVDEPLRTIDNVAILNPPARLVTGGGRQSVGLSLYSTLSRAPHVEPTAVPVTLSDPSLVQEDTVQPHHRESAVHNEKQESLRAADKKHSETEENIREEDDGTARVEIRENLHNILTSVTPSIDSSLGGVSSEDMVIPTSPRPHHHKIDFNEYKSHADLTACHRHASSRRNRLAALTRRVKAIEQKHLEKRKSLIVHFESYIDPSALGYKGRFRMENRHPMRLHTLWRKSSWLKEHPSSGNLTLLDGRLHVKLGGLYFVYVQVNYLGPKQRSGYEIQVNGKSRAHCVISDGGKHHGKMSTCYTGTLLHIKPGDAISIHDLESHCVSLLRADRTFFGLIRIDADI